MQQTRLEQLDPFKAKMHFHIKSTSRNLTKPRLYGHVFTSNFGLKILKHQQNIRWKLQNMLRAIICSKPDWNNVIRSNRNCNSISSQHPQILKNRRCKAMFSHPISAWRSWSTKKVLGISYRTCYGLSYAANEIGTAWSVQSENAIPYQVDFHNSYKIESYGYVFT